MDSVRLVVLLTLAACAGAAAPRPEAPKYVRGDRPAAAADPRAATLAAAIEDWVSLLEKGDLKTAAARWARDADAAAAMKDTWPQLRACHIRYDYRAWIERQPGGGPGAKDVGDAATFTVGGHDFGHHHVKWAKGDAGWRVAGVMVCR